MLTRSHYYGHMNALGSQDWVGSYAEKPNSQCHWSQEVCIPLMRNVFVTFCDERFCVISGSKGTPWLLKNMTGFGAKPLRYVMQAAKKH